MQVRETIRKREDLRERTSAEGETLILDRENGQIHHLNSTASYVWNHCNGLTITAIVEGLSAAFQVDRAQAEIDVVALLNEMRAMNLLQSDCKSPN